MFNGIFINTPVENVARSREFFTAIGFEVDEKYSGEKNVSLKVTDDIRVMCSDKNQFEAMTSKKVASRDNVEVLISVSCTSPEVINNIVESAFTNGANKVNDAEENDFMYSWAFEDLDGHLWDLFCFKPGK